MKFTAIEPALLLRRACLLCLFVLVSCFKQPDSTNTTKTGPSGPAAPDTTAPTAPASVTATAGAANIINLAWSASTDNVGVTEYRVERCTGPGCSNFSEVASTPAGPWNDSGLDPSTTYAYRVRARDAANNFSDDSDPATATTLTIDVALSPRRGGLTPGQTIALTATIAHDIGAAGVNWSMTGNVGGGGFTGTTKMSATFQSMTAGSFTIKATSVADPSRFATTTVGVTNLAGVFTNRYDSQRTGQNQQELALTVATVTNDTFGKLFGCHVNDAIYGQPLYFANLNIPGKGTHNAVFVGTMSNTVYAFDADDPACVTLWPPRSLLQGNEIPVPVPDTDPAAPTRNDIQGQNIGIMGTPVIDPATKTLYVVSKTKESDTVYHQRLHALSLLDGTDKFNGPAEINDSITVPGNADTGDAGIFPTTTCGPAAPGSVPFCALHQNQRPGLLLANNTIYIAWAGHDDIEPFHGWVMGFQAGNLSQAPVVFNATPNNQIYQQTDAQGNPFGGLNHAMGGIWQAGTGPAADAAGNIYIGTGNGAVDTTPNPTNLGDSFIRLTPTLSVAIACGLGIDPCYFTPTNEDAMRIIDRDLDTGGLMLLPDSAGDINAGLGLRRHLAVGGDKNGLLYLLDRDDMGLFNNKVGGGNDSLQEIQLQTIPGGCTSKPTLQFCGVFSTPSYWQGNIYVIAVNDVLKSLPIAAAAINVAQTTHANDIFKFPGAQTAISANGGADGIVWALDTSRNKPPNLLPTILYAYNAITLEKLYSSPATAGAGAAGNSVKFQVPTVANGRVYIGTHDELSVFGLLP